MEMVLDLSVFKIMRREAKGPYSNTQWMLMFNNISVDASVVVFFL
jgi:hypothetical protein